MPWEKDRPVCFPLPASAPNINTYYIDEENLNLLSNSVNLKIAEVSPTKHANFSWQRTKFRWWLRCERDTIPNMWQCCYYYADSNPNLNSWYFPAPSYTSLISFWITSEWMSQDRFAANDHQHCVQVTCNESVSLAHIMENSGGRWGDSSRLPSRDSGSLISAMPPFPPLGLQRLHERWRERLEQGQQTIACRPNPAHHLFL